MFSLSSVPCPYLGKCGGCSEEIENTPENKQISFAQKLYAHWTGYRDAVPMYTQQSLHYRTRMDFTWSKEGLGLKKKNAFDKVIPIEECLIATPKINRLLESINRWFLKNSSPSLKVFDIKSQSGLLKHCVIRSAFHTDEASVTLILNEEEYEAEMEKHLFSSLLNFIDAPHVLLGLVPKDKDLSISNNLISLRGKTPFLVECIKGKSIAYHSQSFFQNNVPVFTLIVNEIERYATDPIQKNFPKTKQLVDLFAGCGVFATLLGGIFKESLIVEMDPLNASIAQHNVEVNGGNARVIETDIFQNPHLPIERGSFVIVDPPRVGLSPKTLLNLMSSEPEHLVYVSCNPPKMIEELGLLYRNYEVVSLSTFDLFPRTPHYEALCILKRRNAPLSYPPLQIHEAL